MRYRGAVAQRNRNGRGMGDTPSWRPDTDAHCYSRALLATLFCAACRAGMPVLSSSLPCPAAYKPLVIRLAAYHASRPPIRHTGSSGPNARQNGSAIDNSAQHRLGVRMGYRRMEIQRSQDAASPGREPARASEQRCPLLFTRTACCFILSSFCIPSRASNLLFGCFLD